MRPQHPADYRKIWADKPVLRAIYTAWYKRMITFCLPGRTLEIGGGAGNFKQFSREVVSTDIQPAHWLNVASDAHRLPFVDASFESIVLMDVLHHLERPPLFFDESARVLKPGGRLVMMEPGITPISGLFYRLFHHEPVDMSCDPDLRGPLTQDRDPYATNQAIPSLLFQGKVRCENFITHFPAFSIQKFERIALFAYPLSGGFRSWSLVPGFLAHHITTLENALAPLLRNFMAFRLFVVLERNS